jgi:hypothetical protein
MAPQLLSRRFKVVPLNAACLLLQVLVEGHDAELNILGSEQWPIQLPTNIPILKGARRF